MAICHVQQMHIAFFGHVVQVVGLFGSGFTTQWKSGNPRLWAKAGDAGTKAATAAMTITPADMHDRNFFQSTKNIIDLSLKNQSL